MVTITKNPSLIPGVSKLSRSAAYKAKGLFNKKKTKPAAKPSAPLTKTVAVKGAKNGGARIVPTTKAAKYYPAEDVPKPKLSRKSKKVSTVKTRASITPGTVLILLAGRYAGKRVVYLKTLASGLLLITGPYKVNGVPLRRVNQAYVIATSTKVDVSKVAVDAKVDDAFFKAEKKAKSAATEEALFENPAKKAVDASRVALQKSVDASILASLKKNRDLKCYLNASFALTKGQAPHLLKF